MTRFDIYRSKQPFATNSYCQLLPKLNRYPLPFRSGVVHVVIIFKMRGLKIILERTIHHLSNMFWTSRTTAKRSDSTARNSFGEDWNWHRDETDLIKRYALFLNVGTSGSILLYQLNLHVNNGVHSLAQFESVKDVFDRDTWQPQMCISAAKSRSPYHAS
jgi:hypothetical protein